MRILGMVLLMIGASICLVIGAGTGLCGLLMASSYGNGALQLLGFAVVSFALGFFFLFLFNRLSRREPPD